MSTFLVQERYKKRLIFEIITISIISLFGILEGQKTVYGSGVDETTPVRVIEIDPVQQQINGEIKTNNGIRELIQKEFGVDHVMNEIVRCESNFRQFDENGEILKGYYNSQDIGVMQINLYYHAEKAKEMNIDLYTTAGNIAYGLYLYQQSGTSPWSASESCWSNHR
jgi:hypothetical protein